MQSLLKVLIVIFSLCSVTTQALTDGELRSTYNFCNRFIDMSYDRQIELATLVRSTVEQAQDACRSIIAQTLAEYIRGVRQTEGPMSPPVPAPGDEEESPSSSVRHCSSANDCGFGQVCVGAPYPGRCVNMPLACKAPGVQCAHHSDCCSGNCHVGRNACY